MPGGIRKKQIPILVAILALLGANMLPASITGVERACAMAAAAAIAYEVSDYLVEKRAELARARAAAAPGDVQARASRNGSSLLTQPPLEPSAPNSPSPGASDSGAPAPKAVSPPSAGAASAREAPAPPSSQPRSRSKRSRRRNPRSKR